MTNTTTLIDEDAFVGRVAELAGMTATKDARQAISATLAVLAEQLPPPEKELVADALPGRWAEMVRTTEQRGAIDAEDLFVGVQRREAVRFGFAREHTQVVCRVLAELTPAALLASVVAVLPEDIGRLFRVPEPPPAPPAHAVTRGEREHTLATGRS
jgi:uncharacterized protein (DUF2267 family)